MQGLFEFLPRERILDAQDAAVENCTGIHREVRGTLFPIHQDEIVLIVQEAREKRIALYPVSTGRNWGYGSASPMADGCVVVNLSRMNRIIDLDPLTGVVTLEPGVTQEQLSRFLAERNLPFLVPTTGAGPTCSIVGNALERGFGLTPHADHFMAVTSIEAVLPDGSLYRPLLAELGGEWIGRHFKWGVGPYLDGLFTQGNFGIVTRMSVALAPRPQRVEGFYFSFADERDLEPAVIAIRELLRDFGPHLGGINLMNDLRVLSMKTRCPETAKASRTGLPPEMLKELSPQYDVQPWMGFGTLYGDKCVLRAVRRHIRRKLQGRTETLVFLTLPRVERLLRFSRFLSFSKGRRIHEGLTFARRSLEIASGIPSHAALPLVYWRSDEPMPEVERIVPDSGDIGLLWYAPIVSTQPEAVRAFVEMASRVCREFGFDPLLTFTSFSHLCMECTLPILFNKSRKGESEKALRCYERLFEEGRAMGFLPYRTGIQGAERMGDASLPFWRMQEKIKKALDPEGIISPGRYSVLK